MPQTTLIFFEIKWQEVPITDLTESIHSLIRGYPDPKIPGLSRFFQVLFAFLMFGIFNVPI